MRLLIITQKVNQNDQILGFFHRWLVEFAKHCEQIVVICLEKGECDLPTNIKVRSLGKETGISRFKYLVNFYRYLWQERQNYDAVFVHMNQEYVWLAGWWWRFNGRPIWLWRNHPQGNFGTRLAVWIADRVFCTSPYSFTARYPQTEIMPVGIDTKLFCPDREVVCRLNSFLFLSRMSPIKKPDRLIEALSFLNLQNDWSLSMIGDPLVKDKKFYDQLQSRVKDFNWSDRVTFRPGVANWQTPNLYRQHEVFINLTPSGSFDKTILEAMACGNLVLVNNLSLGDDLPAELLIENLTPQNLAQKMTMILSWDQTKKDLISAKLQKVVESKHSLSFLAEKLFSQERQNFSASKLKIISPTFLRYLFSGLIVVAVNLLTLAFLTEKLGWWYLTASIWSFFVAFVVSFFLQKTLTYRDNLWRTWNWQLAGYFLISLLNLATNTIILYFLVDWLRLNVIFSQALTVGLISLVLFFVYGRIIFRPKLD